MLSTSNISKTIAGHGILRDVSIEVHPRTATAVVGPNGSGKTTLLRAISLVEAPTEGTISIDDENYVFPRDAHSTFTNVWPTVTMVFQQLALWPHLSLRENILLPIRNKTSPSDSSRYAELVRRLDMEQVVERYPSEVSIGERQRAAIIRAVLLQPKYLLLDEPTSALDVENTQRLLDLLLELKSAGVGILFVSHFLGFAQSLSDFVIFMENGVILESGRPEILTTPQTNRMQKFVSLMESKLVR